MKKIQNVLLLAMALFVSACASSVKFPVSGIAPAAEITATKKADKNGNNKIAITANNLASAERLSPAQDVYVAWIVTKSEGIKSIGRLTNKNAKKATLETSTPFDFNEIFITAQGKDNITYPSGVEISRVKFK
jgi:Flp pilus assembly protein CpaB